MKCCLGIVAVGLATAMRRSGNLRTAGSRPKGAYRQVLYNHQNVQYFAEFHIGGQPIMGIFDTGSFELLTRSTRCTHCKNPTPAYDRTKSHSYRYNGSTVQHVFGSGPCVSMLGYETVEVGPMRSSNQAFWEITDHQIPVMDQAKFAAIVGIGPAFGFGNREKTLLMSYGIEEFSVCLQRESGAHGYLTWGPVASPETKKASFVTVDSLGSHHWTAAMSGVFFAAASQHTPPKGVKPLCSLDQPCAAIVDSGTSLIAAPTEHLMALSSMLPAIKEDCSNLHELPTFHLTLGNGHHFTLPPSAYVMRIRGAQLKANSVWDVLYFKPKIRKLNTCMPAFMNMDMQSDEGQLWILGMPWFRYYHTSFNRINKEIHFATAGAGCEALPYKSNTTSFLATATNAADYVPFDVDVESLIPPSLSSMLEPKLQPNKKMMVVL